MIRSFQFSECRRRSLPLPGIESFIAWIIYENGRGTEERSRVEFQGQPKLHCARSLQRRELLFFTLALSAAIIFCKIRLRYGELFLIHNYLVHNYPSLDVGPSVPSFPNGLIITVANSIPKFQRNYISSPVAECYSDYQHSWEMTTTLIQGVCCNLST